MLGCFLVVWLLGWCLIPHLLLLNKRPTATLAWLWALILFPVAGPALYLMIGSERIKRLRIKRQQDFRQRDRSSPLQSTLSPADKTAPAQGITDPSTQSLLLSLSAITQLPRSTAGSIRVLRKAPAFYEALREDIKRATYHIHIETFIWRDDEVGNQFLDLLVEAAQRGVTVRVLIDEIGSFRLNSRYFRPLLAAGGQFSWYHSLSPLQSRYSFNLRNHRKLQVIDGKIAYVGGMNFGREYLGLDPIDGDWADVQIRVEGEVVNTLQEIFAEDWYFGTGKDDVLTDFKSSLDGEEPHLVQVLRGGPDEEDHPMLRINLALVGHAKTRLWVGCGYFVPGELMQTALQVAASRGVDVRLLVSSKSEHHLLVKAGRSYYEALLRQGVRIYEYDKGIEHSKYLVIDEDLVSVGSSNLDERSMRLNFELSLLTQSQRINQEMAGIFSGTIAESTEIERGSFSRRPYSQKLLESALRPLSPIL